MPFCSVIRAATAAACFLSFATAVAQDASALAARSLAATCFTCHGTNGVSVNNIPPSLAGQSREILLTSLRDFQNGKRPATIMHQQAKGYTDAELVLIAGYFAAQKK